MRSVVVLMIVLASHVLARADNSAEDHAKADQIFEEAQRLKAAGQTVEACKKYDEALAYNRNAVGTLLNVALCNEESGKYATALKYYTLARDLAREHKLVEHLQAAEEHIAKNRPLVAHLAIAFAEQAPNMKLVIDDIVYPVDRTEDIELDPGTHHVVVTAPGRVPYETDVVLEKSAAKAIAVPKLAYPVTVKRGRVTVGKIFTFSGAGLAVTGIVLGIYARNLYNDQIGDPMMGAHCSDTNPPMCDAEGYRLTNDARTYGNVGTVVGSVGVAALAFGAYLWFFAPKEPSEQNLAIVPTATPDSAGVSAIGRF